MKRVGALFVVATAAVAVVVPTRAVAAAPIAGAYVVEFAAAVDPEQAVTKLLERGIQVDDVYRNVFPGVAIHVLPSLVDQLRNDPMIARIEADHIFTLDASDLANQAPVVQQAQSWGLDRIDQRSLPLSGTYSYNDAGAGVTAYIVDSGIYAAHPDFGGRVRSGYSIVADGMGTDDCIGHGTHVAGIVGGQVYGVAKQVSLVAVRVLDCGGSAPFSNIISALNWVIADHPAGVPAVLNMSIGGHAASPNEAAIINQAVQSTVNDGITVVVAAGNAPMNGSAEDACTISPAQAPAALTVAASAENDSRAVFSDYGTCVDLFAPGNNITSDWIGSPPMINTIGGTSMASPHVAGAAAVLLSRRPTWTPAQVVRDLLAAATPNVITDPMGSPDELLYSAPGNPPSNDRFAAATSFDVATTATLSGSNIDATVEPGEPFTGGTSVWWSFVAPENGTFTASTAGSAFTATTAVYTGSAVNALTTVPSGSGMVGAVSVRVERGRTYHLAVDGVAGLQGAIALAFTWSPATFVSVVPERLLETRPGPGPLTVDGLFSSIGARTAGSVTELLAAGRRGIPADASGVVLTVTVTEPAAAGFVTVFPCGSPQPLASNVNFAAGATVANSVVSGIGTGGNVCFFTMADTQLIVDVDGYYPAASSFVSLVPARLMESRSGSGLTTVDGAFAALGVRPAGSVTELVVDGRGGVAANASAVALTVTVTSPAGTGFVTVFPCGSPQSLTSNVNFVAGASVANSVISGVGSGGRVCLFTMVDTHLVVDVNGYFPAGSSFAPLVPGRLLETRSGPGAATVDGSFGGVGIRRAGTVTELPVAGRGGVAADASAVVLTVTVTEPATVGFVTVFPCGSPQPVASNVNFAAGATVANSVVTGIGTGGRVCLFTMSDTHLLVDVDAYFP